MRIGEKVKITAITSNGQAQTAGLKVLDVSKGKSILTVTSEIALQTGGGEKVEVNSLAPSGKLVQVHPVRLTTEPGDIFTTKSSTDIDANRLATVLLLVTPGPESRKPTSMGLN